MYQLLDITAAKLPVLCQKSAKNKSVVSCRSSSAILGLALSWYILLLEVRSFCSSPFLIRPKHSPCLTPCFQFMARIDEFTWHPGLC